MSEKGDTCDAFVPPPLKNEDTIFKAVGPPVGEEKE
jgi:hypothetical protein